jgi:Flp pilus assembly protein TadG
MSRVRVREERGQSMTELALVLPVLMLILFGIIQLGIVFNNYVALTDAVRAGARVAAVSRFSPDVTGDVTAKVKAASGDLNAANVNVTVTPGAGLVHGADVTVKATYPYSINLLGLIVASGSLASTTTERVE